MCTMIRVLLKTVLATYQVLSINLVDASSHSYWIYIMGILNLIVICVIKWSILHPVQKLELCCTLTTEGLVPLAIHYDC